QSAGAVPWAVVVGHYDFSADDEDAEFLARIAKIASAAGAPFLAGASAGLVDAAVGETTMTNVWTELRKKLRETASIGLAAPRVLLRLPYGKDTESIDRFDFEEMPGGP